jgi:hypothetical protein
MYVITTKDSIVNTGKNNGKTVAVLVEVLNRDVILVT